MVEKNKIIEKWYSADIFYTKIKEFINPAFSIMDIGCGIRPQQYIIPDLLICVEPHQEYVEILKKNLSGTNSIIIPFEAKVVLETFLDKSVDSIFLMDVIEHMPKEMGKEILVECERVARKQIIIFTPLGFMPQEVHDTDGWNLHGGEWQEHKSGWYPNDFPDWNIIGCKNLHTHDFKGQALSTPYGGFYAIKNVTHFENCFNDVYAKEILLNATSNLESLKAIFPQFINQTIYNELMRSTLKSALSVCQRTTELLVTKGKTTPIKEILEMVHNEKVNFFINAVQECLLKINNFASQFKDLNDLQCLLNSANAQINHLQELLKSTTNQLEVLKGQLKIKEQALESNNKNLS
ncbi:hypothetical protein A3306_06035 [Rickettsia bellii]|uniref:Methyltransferase domain protein n=1 Tax=Rickettsia bellii str. RML An4 TaxID=1359193 RepID=A0A0F3QDY2_RICBE|nr:class I SAM-dependent methyltransferase [Rickettsia bellii]ABV79265.1 hypothetical protein A1I_04630 [Rickettsia bellii OSU 85-389]ARD86692.1 hypothetical protein A3306_06035 [Rickettsia bellii]KJV89629.1 methyltransferase domain protein [Rickettsia bellii str. RML An4]